MQMQMNSVLTFSLFVVARVAKLTRVLCFTPHHSEKFKNRVLRTDISNYLQENAGLKLLGSETRVLLRNTSM